VNAQTTLVVGVVVGVVVASFTLLMTLIVDSFLLDAVVGIVRGWVSFYTRDLPVEIRDSRRAEMESDLYEQRTAMRDLGHTPRGMALSILLRCVRGVGSDLSWRGQLLPAIAATNEAPASRWSALWETVYNWIMTVRTFGPRTTGTVLAPTLLILSALVLLLVATLAGGLQGPGFGAYVLLGRFWPLLTLWVFVSLATAVYVYVSSALRAHGVFRDAIERSFGERRARLADEVEPACASEPYE
jgi:hypothetical protein